MISARNLRINRLFSHFSDSRVVKRFSTKHSQLPDLSNFNWYESFLIRNRFVTVESVNNFNGLFELHKYRLIGSEELERLKIDLDSQRKVLEMEKQILRDKRKESLDAKLKLTSCKNIIKFYKDGRGSGKEIRKEDYIQAISDEYDLEIVVEESWASVLEQQSKVEEIQTNFDNLAFLKYDENAKIERNSQVRALIILLLSPIVQFIMFRYLEPIKRTKQLQPLQEELSKDIEKLTDNLNQLTATIQELKAQKTVFTTSHDNATTSGNASDPTSNSCNSDRVERVSKRTASADCQNNVNNSSEAPMEDIGNSTSGSSIIDTNKTSRNDNSSDTSSKSNPYSITKYFTADALWNEDTKGAVMFCISGLLWIVCHSN